MGRIPERTSRYLALPSFLFLTCSGSWHSMTTSRPYERASVYRIANAPLSVATYTRIKRAVICARDSRRFRRTARRASLSPSLLPLSPLVLEIGESSRLCLFAQTDTRSSRPERVSDNFYFQCDAANTSSAYPI